MYRIDYELTGQSRYKELLKEAERERLAAEAGRMPWPFYRSAVYLIGSSLVQLGQRLERGGTSRTINPSPSAISGEP